MSVSSHCIARGVIAAAATLDGVSDATSADRSLPDQTGLEQALRGTRWRRIEVVAETGSTNADLAARADAGEDLDGQVRIAGFQSAGRGRHARLWQTPHGQIAVSAGVAVRPDQLPAIGWLSLLTGLAAAEAVLQVTGVRPDLKWPNDVLAPSTAAGAGKKLAGILSEFHPAGDSGGGAAIIGTGLNLDLTGAEPPIETAASLRELAGAPVDATELTAAYLRALSERLVRWPHDLPGLAADYRAASATLGRQVRLILPGDREVVGEAVDIDDEGRIVVDAPGQTVAAAAGDVTHLRAV